MKHKVLARKWRPKKFADLVGQNLSVTILKNIIGSDRLHHAYLLTGTRGVGKTTIARIIAKSLNCLNLENNEPCTICRNCLAIDYGNYVDVIEIDAASNTGVDNIRELIDNSQYVPTEGKYKIYIIDEVHMLSKSAFNAMLKTLEEPPKHIIFILATTDLPKVPITILSRTLQLKLRHLLPNEIALHLAFILNEEKIIFEVKALDIIAKAAQGSMRDALSLLDQAIAYSNNNITEPDVKQMLGISDESYIFQILDAIKNLDAVNLVKLSQAIYNEGNDLEQILQSLSEKLWQINLAQLVPNQEQKDLSIYTNSISVNDIQLYFEIVNLGLEQLAKVNDKLPIFNMTLLRMLAFTIGSTNNKQNILTNTNIQDNIKNSVTKTVNETSPNTELLIKNVSIPLEFNGDWFNLIETCKSELGHLYPFLVNSELIDYKNKTFELSIDSNYKNSINTKSIPAITNILSKHLNYQVQINIDFAEKLTDTLKVKQIAIQSEIQKKAEEDIHSDANLVKILDQFSAKIVPGTIKAL